MLQPKKFTPKQKKAAKTVDKVVKASVIAKLLNNIPGAETIYDISNVLKSVSEGDPIKIGSNTVGALLPGVSGKAFEAVAEDYLPPVSKKQINKNKKVLQGKRATSEEVKKTQSNSGFSEGMDVLKKDITNFFSDLLAFGTGEDGIGDPPTRLAFENELLSRVITERNKDKNFVQRALNPSDYPVIINEDDSETTHLMQYSTDDKGNAYVSPTVIQNGLGLLEKLPPRQAVKYGRESGEEIKIPDIQLAEYFTENGLIKHAYGTNSQGIMKKKMNPVKRYANGTNAKGIDPNHFIISPAEALNDYDIMLAKAEEQAVNNPWLPIVATTGALLQKGVNIAGNFATPGTAAMGMNNVQEDVEVEGGEVYETPQGQVGEFKGPSHEQGGIPLEVGQDVEEGTKVYSDRLKIGNKTLAERKATRERQIANLEKIASNNLADEAVKNAAKRKMQAIQKEEAADLQFQDQVNNIQAMADTMVKAFGTGAEGIQTMANGGIIGDPTKPWKLPVSRKQDDPNYAEIVNASFEEYLGGANKKSNALLDNLITTTEKDTETLASALKNIPVESTNEEDTPVATLYQTPSNNKKKNSIIPTETTSLAEEFAPNILDVMEGPQGNARQFGNFKGDTPEHFEQKDGTKINKVLEKVGENIPAVGDLTKLLGNYLGMTAGIKTATEQRATDVTHRNTFANAGEESQRLLDNAKQGIETSKAQAIVKATTVGRGGKKGARGSARGVNTMRATDWLYDTALQQQIAEISANAANQIANIDTQKSQVALNADQLKGQGEYQAAMANEAAKDAYYTALALGRKDFATGMQQSGADLNAMKQNKILEKLLTQDGEYVGMTTKGEFFGKPAKKRDTKNAKSNVIEIPDGKGGVLSLTMEEYQKLLTTVTK